MWTLSNILASENSLKNYSIERGMIKQQINSCTSEYVVACQVRYPKLLAMNSSKLLYFLTYCNQIFLVYLV